MFIPEPNFSIPDPGSKQQRIPVLDPQQRVYVFLTQKNVIKLFKVFGMFLKWSPDPDYFPSWVPDQDRGVEEV
jgi:hypothetical protein